MNTLIIDTANNKEIKIGLETDGKKYAVKKKILRNKGQIVLQIIDMILEENKLTIGNIDKVKVNIKYGSFMVIRIGLSVANALSFALKIPVEKLPFD